MKSLEWDDSDFRKRISQYKHISEDAIRRGLFAAGEDLRGESLKIVPFDRGVNGGLASTANTLHPTAIGSTMLETVVGYNRIYAARLHEDMTLVISQKKAKGARRSQKYLEIPLKRDKDKYGKILAKLMKEAT